MVGFVVCKKLSCMPKPSEIFVTPYERTCYGNKNCRPPATDYKCTVYSIGQLAELIGLLRVRGEDTIRYLVDPAHYIWFALEGPPSKTVPAHWQMTDEYQSSAKCLAAGNIRFSKSYEEITVINHKSGDFRPEFTSLQLVLAILAQNRAILESQSIKLASDLSIDRLSSSGGPEATFIINLEDLYSWVAEKFPTPLLPEKLKPTKTLVGERRSLKRSRSERDEESDNDEETSASKSGSSGDDSKRRRIGVCLHKLELTDITTTMPLSSASLSPLALFSSGSTELADEEAAKEPLLARAPSTAAGSNAAGALALLTSPAPIVPLGPAGAGVAAVGLPSFAHSLLFNRVAESTAAPAPVCRALSF